MPGRCRLGAAGWVSATVPQLTAAAAGETERRAASRGRGHRVTRYRRAASPYKTGRNAHKEHLPQNEQEPSRLTRTPDGRRPAGCRYSLHPPHVKEPPTRPGSALASTG